MLKLIEKSENQLHMQNQSSPGSRAFSVSAHEMASFTELNLNKKALPLHSQHTGEKKL